MCFTSSSDWLQPLGKLLKGHTPIYSATCTVNICLCDSLSARLFLVQGDLIEYIWGGGPVYLMGVFLVKKENYFHQGSIGG